MIPTIFNSTTLTASSSPLSSKHLHQSSSLLLIIVGFYHVLSGSVGNDMVEKVKKNRITLQAIKIQNTWYFYTILHDYNRNIMTLCSPTDQIPRMLPQLFFQFSSHWTSSAVQLIPTKDSEHQMHNQQTSALYQYVKLPLNLQPWNWLKETP